MHSIEKRTAVWGTNTYAIFLFWISLENNKLWTADANPGEDTTERFQEINRAYEVLNDPDLKKKYDMFGEQGIGTSAASDQTAGSPFGDLSCLVFYGFEEIQKWSKRQVSCIL